MRSHSTIIICLLSATIAIAAEPPVRVNQVQVIGTHNSYHVAPSKDLREFLGSIKKEYAEHLDYTHRPLPEQLGKLGIRQVELDVFADPKGGLYAEPLAYKTLKMQGKNAGVDPNEGGKLAKPGFKVLHIQDFDYLSTVPTLEEGLKQIRDWSLANPKHLPICVMLELKDQVIDLLPTKPVKFDVAMLDEVDKLILATFKRTHLFTPDDLRGKYNSLPKAISEVGWPAIDDVRGKVFFALDNEGGMRADYIKGHPGLKGRVMFVGMTDEKAAEAAWFKVNDPIKQFERIQTLSKAGFLIRTRADESTIEARKNDTTRRDKAFASGAHFISTDFPETRKDISEYRVAFPEGGTMRVNPVSGKGLKVLELEPLSK